MRHYSLHVSLILTLFKLFGQVLDHKKQRYIDQCGFSCQNTLGLFTVLK